MRRRVKLAELQPVQRLGGPGINDGNDAAYGAKYRRYPGNIPSIVSPRARSVTIRLVPRNNERRVGT